MNPLVSAGIALLLAAACAGAGYRAGSAIERARQADVSAAILETADAVEHRTAERISGIKVVSQVVSGKVREVVRENVVYRDCLVGDELQRLLDSARQGQAGDARAALSRGLPSTGTSPPP